jgi:hypothetical protein
VGIDRDNSGSWSGKRPIAIPKLPDFCRLRAWGDNSDWRRAISDSSPYGGGRSIEGIEKSKDSKDIKGSESSEDCGDIDSSEDSKGSEGSATKA